MDAATQLQLGIVLFLSYTVLLVIGTVSTGRRFIAFKQSRLPPPRLLIRDFILIGGHAVTLLLISGARVLAAAGLIATSTLAGEPWWWIVTSVPALVAVGTYVYFEIFVIR